MNLGHPVPHYNPLMHPDATAVHPFAPQTQPNLAKLGYHIPGVPGVVLPPLIHPGVVIPAHITHPGGILLPLLHPGVVGHAIYPTDPSVSYHQVTALNGEHKEDKRNPSLAASAVGQAVTKAAKAATDAHLEKDSGDDAAEQSALAVSGEQAADDRISQLRTQEGLLEQQAHSLGVN